MLKKKILYIVLTTVCMLILSACSSDESSSSTPEKEKEEKQEEKKEKTPIDLTVGLFGESLSLTRAATRTVYTNDNDDNTNGKEFQKGTSLYMVIKAENEDVSTTEYTRSIGYAQTKVDDNNTTVDFSANYMRYWEDAFPSNDARKTKITIYSACVPGYYLSDSKPSGITANGTEDSTTPWTIGGSSTYNSNTWGTEAQTTTIAWPLRTGVDANVSKQTTNFITSQDLCFSNNVSKQSESADKRLQFNSSGKIINNRLVFYHALTWVTFKIKKGEGFGDGADEFKFTNADENIVLKGFNTSGTFDISQGEFKTSEPAIGTADITKLASETPLSTTDSEAGYTYVLHALMLPGSNLAGDDEDATDKIYFTIDNNLYHITKTQLKNALNDKKLSDESTTALTDDSKMRPGVHYIFKMEVGKQKMDKLTASVVSWEEVEAEEIVPTNARIKLNLFDQATHVTETDNGTEANFYLYRTPNVIPENETITDNYEKYDWKTGYFGNKGKLVWNSTENVYIAKYIDNDEDSSNDKFWYWPDNKTFYHFRTVYPKKDANNADYSVTQDATNGDYITLKAGSTYLDVEWGAPFYKYTNNNTSDVQVPKFTYSVDTGFDNTTGDYHQISKAIGPTTDKINMVMFHMMSDVTIKITTSDGDDQVDISETSLNISNTYSNGKVLMGTGQVIPGSSKPDVTGSFTSSGGEYKWNYGFIPQSLENVELTIVTKDHNKYIITMDEVTTSTVRENIIKNPYSKDSNNKYILHRWYPNYKYTYNFKLTKSGVSKVTATITDWESVTAEEQGVKIK